MSHVIVVTICPPAVVHGAEFAHPFTRKPKTLSAHNTYGRLQRTERRDNAKPGDVAKIMCPLCDGPEAA